MLVKKSTTFKLLSQQHKVDGRALFQYHLDANYYHALKNQLYTRKELLTNNINIHNSACFVLFASEWYRREYDGSDGWSWKGIWHALGYELDSQEIEQVVVKGLEKYWKRPIKRNARGRNFLGSVFSEGGLPFLLLQQEKNNFSTAMHNIFAQYPQRSLRGQTTKELVEYCIQDLPSALKENDTVELIIKIVERLMQYVKYHELEQQKNPAKYLDNYEPEWRKTFPIPLDQETGKALLDRWLQDATEESKRTRKIEDSEEVNCRHALVKTDQGFQIKTYIDLPKKLTLKVKKKELSSTRLELIFFEGSHIFLNLGISYAQFDGEKVSIRVRKAIAVGFKKYYDRHIRLCIQDSGRIIEEIFVENSDMAIYEMPFIFVENDDEWQLQGFASVNLENSKARILFADNLKFKCENENYEIIDVFKDIGWVIETTENIQYYSADGDIYKIKLNLSNVNENNLTLIGNMLSWESKPYNVYLGKPQLDVNGIEKISECWNRQETNNLITGVVNYTARNENNETLLRRRFGILPKSFKVTLHAGRNIQEASLKIYGVDDYGIKLSKNNTIKTSLIKNSNYQQLNLFCESLPPKDIVMEIFAPQSNNDPIYITLPFPIVGAIIFDEDGCKIEKNRLLISDLWGTRLHMFAQAGRTEKFTIELILISKKHSINAPREEIRCRVGDKPDIRSLYSLKDKIIALLALDNSLDARVEFSVKINAIKDKDTCFLIQRYDETLEIDEKSGEICLEQSANINSKSFKPKAMLLHKPEKIPECLPEKLFEGYGVGRFYTSPKLDNEGPWLIYPDESSVIQFRPTLFRGKGSPSSKTNSIAHSLCQAVKVYHPNKNPDVIKEQITKMMNNFDDSGWDYLRTLLEKYSHLPLSTFEVWKAVSRNEFSLASLIFRLECDSEMMFRIETELSVVWERVTLEAWINAKKQYNEWLVRSGISERMADGLVKKNIENLSNYYQGLCEFTDYLLYENKDKLGRITESSIIDIIKNSWYQDLLRTHASNDSWPTWLRVRLRDWALSCKSLSVFIPLNKPNEILWRDAVTIFPFFMAAVTVGRVKLDDFIQDEIFESYYIKSLRDFDREWFYSVYSASISILLRKG